MNASDLIDLRMRTPFVPFGMHLKDGSTVRVPVPTVIAISRKGSECVVYEGADRIRFVPYRDIVEVTMEPANGSRQAES
jgi:hypothetical protein